MGEVLSFCAKEDVLFHRGLKNQRSTVLSELLGVGGGGSGRLIIKHLLIY